MNVHLDVRDDVLPYVKTGHFTGVRPALGVIAVLFVVEKRRRKGTGQK